MAALSHVLQPPAFVTPDDYTNHQQSTPSSFTSRDPVLRFRKADTSIYFSPAPDNLPSCFSQLCSTSADTDVDATVAMACGELFLTEQDFCFVSDGTGIRLTYPAIALHAVTRTLPAFISPTGTGAASSEMAGCLYCQLDLSVATSDSEDDSLFFEMYIVTPDQTSLDQLFEALSHCASLHPSIMGGEDEADAASGHPFAGFAPFGTDANGHHLRGSEDDAFDDAEDDNDFVSDLQQEQAQADRGELSETGRRNLAHLESVMQWPSDDEDEQVSMSSYEGSNTLILSNLPMEFFIPQICSLLLSLLNTYGDLVRWTPLPNAERAIVVFQDIAGAALAKAGLDRLVLPFEDDAQGAAQVERATDEDDGTILRAVFGPYTDPNAEPDTLAVPTTDKNFLISPPGSPPVGWEPIREDPPNRDTLADDLIRALGNLRDTGSHFASHQPKEWGANESAPSSSASHRARPGEPEIILAPSSAAPLKAFQPAWLTGNQHAVQQDNQDSISIPGVSVQSFDGEEEEADQSSKTYNGYSISSVKATVESMRSPSSSTLSSGLGTSDARNNRITPTGRPPLGSDVYRDGPTP